MTHSLPLKVRENVAVVLHGTRHMPSCVTSAPGIEPTAGSNKSAGPITNDVPESITAWYPQYDGRWSNTPLRVALGTCLSLDGHVARRDCPSLSERGVPVTIVRMLSGGVGTVTPAVPPEYTFHRNTVKVVWNTPDRVKVALAGYERQKAERVLTTRGAVPSQPSFRWRTSVRSRSHPIRRAHYVPNAPLVVIVLDGWLQPGDGPLCSSDPHTSRILGLVTQLPPSFRQLPPSFRPMPRRATCRWRSRARDAACRPCRPTRWRCPPRWTRTRTAGTR